MKLLTGKQMAEIDYKAINELQIDGLILMENAGIKVYQHIKEIVDNWSEQENTSFRNVVIVAGKGNNGGDGFVIARHLVINSIPVTVYAVSERSEYTGDALKNYLALENFCDINIISDDTIEDLRDSVIEASIVVDALLGTGLKGSVEGIYAETIEILNEAEGIIISVDIPSGVNADTGTVDKVAVEADYTVTFATIKLGQVLYPGADYVGELKIVDIGIPQVLIDNNDSRIFMTKDHNVYEFLPWRPEESNKGTYGKVLTIAGSKNMTGAGLLSAFSALKAGAGTSVLASPASILPQCNGVYPEITFFPLKETMDQTISTQALKDLETVLSFYQVVVLGPGISTDNETINFIKGVLPLIKDKEIPLVVDADALNCISELSGVKLSENVVITPHPKELARLLGIKPEEVLEDRIKFARQACDQYNCNVVLKGSKTLIVTNDTIYVNPTGNSGLATAGTGDVLSGIIAGLIAQGMEVYNASVAGVFIHGLAGDLASDDNTEYSLVATDVIKYISKAFKRLSLL